MYTANKNIWLLELFYFTLKIETLLILHWCALNPMVVVGFLTSTLC